MIADLPKRFYVPYILSSTIPKWSKHDSDEIEVFFEFAFHFLHDDAYIFLFVSVSKNVRLDV